MTGIPISLGVMGRVDPDLTCSDLDFMVSWNVTWVPYFLACGLLVLLIFSFGGNQAKMYTGKSKSP